MKSPKMLLATLAVCASLSAFSQTDTTRKDTTTTKKDTSNITSASHGSESSVAPEATQQSAIGNSANAETPQTTTSTTTEGTNAGSSAGQQSVSAERPNQQTFPQPNFGRYYIPVLGSYQSSQAGKENKTITIAPDESNPGKVWIEGLTDVKIYALLKSSPGTYKIPMQKQQERNVPEGFLAYDENSKQINICLGCGYADNNISNIEENKGAAGQHKSGKTVTNFTGTKTEEGTAGIK